MRPKWPSTASGFRQAGPVWHEVAEQGALAGAVAEWWPES